MKMNSQPKHRSNSDKDAKSDQNKQSSLRDLLKTSRAIKRVLEPLIPRKSFLSELAENLDSNVDLARGTMQNIEHRKQKVKWTAIGAGVGIYCLSLSIVFIKLMKWLLKRRSNNISGT